MYTHLSHIMSLTVTFTRDDAIDLVSDLNELLSLTPDELDDDSQEDIKNIVDTLPEVLHLLWYTQFTHIWHTMNTQITHHNVTPHVQLWVRVCDINTRQLVWSSVDDRYQGDSVKVSRFSRYDHLRKSLWWILINNSHRPLITYRNNVSQSQSLFSRLRYHVDAEVWSQRDKNYLTIHGHLLYNSDWPVCYVKALLFYIIISPPAAYRRVPLVYNNPQGYLCYFSEKFFSTTTFRSRRLMGPRVPGYL